MVGALRGELGTVHTAAWGAALLTYAAWRSFRPLHFHGDVRGTLLIAVDVGVNVAAVALTGYWDSPFVFCLITAVITAGFAQGFVLSIMTAAVAATGVSAPYYAHAHGTAGFSMQASGQWTIELALVAVVASYARRLFGQVEQRHSLALDRMSRLAEANALLFSLHRIAQSLPASLDLDEVLASTMGRMRDLFDFDTAAVVLRDDTTGSWIVGAAEGVRLKHSLLTSELPVGIVQAMESETAVVVPNLPKAGSAGLGLMTFSALYAPLRARGQLVGVIALEHHAPGHFSAREVELVQGFVEPAALAIDNARWFGRLRTVGADEERTRIARDLHDRLGQSLAYLAFELDRILKRSQKELVHNELQQLRQDVRGVVSEMRETLYDLRTDVSETHDVVDTLEDFLRRVEERTHLQISFRHDRQGRLPLPQERELWRVAQEAITNVERHARATHMSVSWHCDGESALLAIYDDGQGFPAGYAGRMDSYGIIGMRERADSIGARLEIESAPGQGTTVRCRLHAGRISRP
ncbi:MAG: Signal transduction histidine kinase [Acidimicrobiales bacterium]|jgi:signal transduction histidine kinase|nr:Signal transduction histidine kinase [Acidimicrobiales bacterium]